MTIVRWRVWGRASVGAAASLVLAAFAGACGESGGTAPDPDPEPTASSLTLTAPIGTLLPVDWQTLLGVLAFDEDGAPLAVSPAWTSDAPAVASISTVGLVSTHTPGPAVVTATVDGVDANLPLTVVHADLDLIETLLTDPYAAQLVTLWGGTSADEYAAGVHTCRTHLGLGNLTAVLLCVDEGRGRLDAAAAAETAAPRALLGLFLDGAERLVGAP